LARFVARDGGFVARAHIVVLLRQLGGVSSAACSPRESLNAEF
jgi:hypothetical protein